MDRNIFEAVSRKLGKKIENKIEKNPSVEKKPLRHSSEPSTPVEAKEKKLTVYDSEVFHMIERMHQMKQDLDRQLIELRQKGTQYHVDVDKYIEKSKIHYPKDFEKANQVQQKLVDQIEDLFPPEACIRKNPKTKEKLTQERKGKTLGLRKKWIPIH